MNTKTTANTITALEVGAVVSVESGRYKGCRLTFVGIDALGWYVCLNSNEVGGYVRVRRVEFVRGPATRESCAATCDDVMWNHFQRTIAQAREYAGVK